MELNLITKTLLKNRGLITKLQQEEFFSPINPSDQKSPFNSEPAINLIKKHIGENGKIAIYGDYDVDGICSTAILWETLHANYENVFPHIPHRESEGYGLSIKGIDHCLSQGASLIIAVDNGIVAHKEIAYCKEKGCDIIIIDHHEPDTEIAKPTVLLHSTSTCAAALSWFFARDFLNQPNLEHQSLVAIAVICDMVPLVGINRSFAKFGLEELNRTNRVGLQALFAQAAIQKGDIKSYEVGFVIGPRLNAMGRLEHAIDSLRLLCTTSSERAAVLAQTVGETNKSRQDLTQEAVKHALESVQPDNKVLIVASETYNQGIIGLIASKLVEKYHRPAIAIAIGESECKGSARSVSGFHITNHIRSAAQLLLGVGGHAMAAGFSVEKEKLSELISLLSVADIADDLLVKKTRIDMEIPIERVDERLYAMVQEFAPFGLGNPIPIFKSSKLNVSGVKKIGKSLQHSKLQINGFEGMAFNIAEIPENPVEIVYSVDKNTWNGVSKLQLIVKNIQHNNV